MNDIFKMAEQAYHALSIAETELKRLYKENAELKNSLNREWVGLTEEDIDDIWKTEYFNLHYELPKAIEAKLKEKNCG